MSDHIDHSVRLDDSSGADDSYSSLAGQLDMSMVIEDDSSASNRSFVVVEGIVDEPPDSEPRNASVLEAEENPAGPVIVELDAPIPLGHHQYWCALRLAPDYCSAELAYRVLRDYKTLVPHLADVTKDEPVTNLSRSDVGYYAIARRNEETVNFTCRGPWKATNIPGTNRSVQSHNSNVGNFIRTIFKMDNFDYILVHYSFNVSGIKFVQRMPTAHVDKGGMSYGEAFHSLRNAGGVLLKTLPSVECDKYVNYSFTVLAGHHLNYSPLATEDDLCWVQKRKHLPVIVPKWEKKHLLVEDVKQNKYAPLTDEQVLVTPAEDMLVLRRQRSSHPAAPLQRLIFFISDMQNSRQILSDRVVYQYIVAGSIPPGSLVRSISRTSQRVMELIRVAMDGRNVESAREFLKQHNGLNIPAHVIINAARRNKVPTFIRNQVGDKQVTDLVKLVKSTLAGSGGYTVIENLHSPSGFHVQLFPENYRCVAAGLPTSAALKAHRRKCRVLDELDSSSQRIAYFNKEFIPMQNDCALLKGVSGVVMVDVTFGVSPLYVTIVYASANNFVTDRSDKTRYIIVALIYHPNKTMELHASVVSALNKLSDMYPEYKNRRFSALLTDGEESLKVYLKANMCIDAVHLKCSVHMRENMTNKNRNIDTSAVFGKMSETDHPMPFLNDDDEGASSAPRNMRIMRNYLLGSLTLDDYERAKDELMESSKVLYKVKKFVRNKGISMYEFYGLRRKLEGCYIAQWTSTNHLESLNNLIKVVFDGKRSVEESLPKVIAFGDGQLRELLNAVMGKGREARLLVPHDWSRLNDAEKEKLLEKLGMSYPGDNVWEEVSPAFVKVVTSDRLRHISMLFNEYTVHLLDEKLVSLVYRCPNVKTQQFLLEVKKHDDTIKTLCLNNCLQDKLVCDHQLLYFMSLSPEDRNSFVRGHHNVDEHRRIMAANNRGAGSKRRGREFSKGNHSRKIDLMINGSLFSNDSTATDTSSAAGDHDSSSGDHDSSSGDHDSSSDFNGDDDHDHDQGDMYHEDDHEEDGNAALVVLPLADTLSPSTVSSLVEEASPEDGNNNLVNRQAKRNPKKRDPFASPVLCNAPVRRPVGRPKKAVENKKCVRFERDTVRGRKPAANKKNETRSKRALVSKTKKDTKKPSAAKKGEGSLVKSCTKVDCSAKSTRSGRKFPNLMNGTTFINPDEREPSAAKAARPMRRSKRLSSESVDTGITRKRRSL